MILFTAAYRLFFPAAGLFAAAAIPLWLVIFSTGNTDLFDPLGWHMHEMLFGFLPAALAGFLLTAIPNWTGRPALTGAPLVALFTLWLAGRIVLLFFSHAYGTEFVTLAFLPLLALIAGRDILAARNRRNYVVVALILALWFAQGVFFFVDNDLGASIGLAVSLVLLALIAGRVTPAFSRNWLKKRGATALPAPFGLIDRAALGLTTLAAVIWVLSGPSQATGILSATAAVSLAARLARWKAWHVKGEPLLLAQHAGYAWLVIGTGLIALHSLTDLATMAQVRHAIGAGAVGTIAVIVMLRAILGHSGRPIEGTTLDWTLLGALHLGAVLRVSSGWFGEPMGLLHASGALWSLGMVLFVIRIIPIALAPRL